MNLLILLNAASAQEELDAPASKSESLSSPSPSARACSIWRMYASSSSDPFCSPNASPCHTVAK